MTKVKPATMKGITDPACWPNSIQAHYMTPELLRLCEQHYGPRWWLGLAADISRLSGATLRQMQRTTLRWKTGETDPSPAAVTAIILLSAPPPSASRLLP